MNVPEQYWLNHANDILFGIELQLDKLQSEQPETADAIVSELYWKISKLSRQTYRHRRKVEGVLHGLQ